VCRALNHRRQQWVHFALGLVNSPIPEPPWLLWLTADADSENVFLQEAGRDRNALWLRPRHHTRRIGTEIQRQHYAAKAFARKAEKCWQKFQSVGGSFLRRFPIKAVQEVDAQMALDYIQKLGEARRDANCKYKTDTERLLSRNTLLFVWIAAGKWASLTAGGGPGRWLPGKICGELFDAGGLGRRVGRGGELFGAVGAVGL
jgi:hypothetical protein